MSGWLGTAELAGLAMLAFSVAAVLAAAIAYPLLRQPLAGTHPRLRAAVALATALGPVVLPLLLLGLALLPSLAGWAGIRPDHCPAHGDHPHLCVVHGTAALGPVANASLALLAVALGAALLAGVYEVCRSRRALATLARSAIPGPRPGVWLVASEAPVSFAAGWWRPRIYLSDGLVTALGEDGVEVVIAHERAHARRRDALRQALARAAARLHLPRLRARLLADLALASEQACDEAAASEVGDRLRVAETLLAAERRLGARLHAAPACGFAESAVARRVRALLEPAAPLPPARQLRGAALSLALLALLFADPLHHATEHLLALLLR